MLIFLSYEFVEGYVVERGHNDIVYNHAAPCSTMKARGKTGFCVCSPKTPDFIEVRSVSTCSKLTARNYCSLFERDVFPGNLNDFVNSIGTKDRCRNIMRVYAWESSKGSDLNHWVDVTQFAMTRTVLPENNYIWKGTILKIILNCGRCLLLKNKGQVKSDFSTHQKSIEVLKTAKTEIVVNTTAITARLFPMSSIYNKTTVKPKPVTPRSKRRIDVLVRKKHVHIITMFIVVLLSIIVGALVINLVIKLVKKGVVKMNATNRDQQRFRPPIINSHA